MGCTKLQKKFHLYFIFCFNKLIYIYIYTRIGPLSSGQLRALRGTQHPQACTILCITGRIFLMSSVRADPSMLLNMRIVWSSTLVYFKRYVYRVYVPIEFLLCSHRVSCGRTIIEIDIGRMSYNVAAYQCPIELACKFQIDFKINL